MIKVSVVGASGYSGIYLIYALSLRQDVSLSFITSQSFAGKKISEAFPLFAKSRFGKNQVSSLSFIYYDEEAIASSSDIVFFCLPHGESSKLIPNILKKNNKIKIVDIGADYRFDDLKTYEEFYGEHNSSNELNSQFVYGLGDIFYEKIKNSQFVANPGCYPTGALLPLLPLFFKHVIDLENPVIINALSGISGAGRGLKLPNLFCEVENSVKAYNVWSHRHLPEIKEKITAALLANSKREEGISLKVLFTPHMIPVTRGILTTIYLKLKDGISERDIFAAYNDFYNGSPFVSILENAAGCDIKNVIYSNNCHIALETGKNKGEEGFLKIFSVIDNLGKGASLQAVQNMNLMFNLEPDFGIAGYSPFP
ncbi:MAG: N-acetyl-gamma-glutamyl-phosphate reductase [Deltaproteobacteria bacterium]|jgi:N-acetyl-gamma-glutamyl-phosphate reductase|nr:N-acetyl-gamma-glutamyl-phosphate reductase [Deltaproteobacteria bacterium]MCL5879999.1 N-acetyl-gamma-glutamyl-phosphate reductase [Deltaproteobacteria bacterium]MDA8304706.1 N-acetyl-gamma-glutamyl-phosphate reductase [Deltaproteobacteria bacterium]